MTKFLNPLEMTASSEKPLESTSALDNDAHGTCPKCKGQMVSDAQLPTGETVYYCESCRVASPKPAGS